MITFANPQSSGTTATIKGPGTITAYFYSNSGGGGGGGCVLNGTLITLANGTQAPVQNLKAGDHVLSYNTRTGSLSTTTVASNKALLVHKVLDINNGTLRISGLGEQLIYARMQNGTQRNIDIGQLKVGMQLYEPASKSWVTITSLQVLTGDFVVFDLRTTNGNNYIANLLCPCPK
ncbi:MAG: hypothetical protein HY296_03125 [Thaumarchaeota archaeon]|nr:hypothetical protein [Nitrososphaerota archaeon]